MMGIFEDEKFTLDHHSVLNNGNTQPNTPSLTTALVVDDDATTKASTELR